jgi:hypothetical protein
MENSGEAPLREAPAPPRRRWIVGWPIAEVFLIALGVFLGLAAEQWRDRADRNERAAEALRRIRAEMAANREEIKRVVNYHVTAQQKLKEYLSASAEKRAALSVRLEGIQPVQFERTAWQLALATQALVDIDPGLSFALARTYGYQARYEGLTEGITGAMYLRPPGENLMGFFHSLSLYYADVVELEPALAKMYDEMLPQIDRALDQ